MAVWLQCCRRSVRLFGSIFDYDTCWKILLLLRRKDRCRDATGAASLVRRLCKESEISIPNRIRIVTSQQDINIAKRQTHSSKLQQWTLFKCPNQRSGFFIVWKLLPLWGVAFFILCFLVLLDLRFNAMISKTRTRVSTKFFCNRSVVVDPFNRLALSNAIA